MGQAVLDERLVHGALGDDTQTSTSDGGSHRTCRRDSLVGGVSVTWSGGSASAEWSHAQIEYRPRPGDRACDHFSLGTRALVFRRRSSRDTRNLSRI